jgi:hypothetical protein
MINYLAYLCLAPPPRSDGPAYSHQFETWILVQNPGEEVAQVSLTYMTPDGVVDGPEFELAPGARTSFNLAETLPETREVSTKVESSRPVIAERAMYCHYYEGRYYRQSAHCSIGVPGPLELNRH